MQDNILLKFELVPSLADLPAASLVTELTVFWIENIKPEDQKRTDGLWLAESGKYQILFDIAGVSADRVYEAIKSLHTANALTLKILRRFNLFEQFVHSQSWAAISLANFLRLHESFFDEIGDGGIYDLHERKRLASFVVYCTRLINHGIGTRGNINTIYQLLMHGDNAMEYAGMLLLLEKRKMLTDTLHTLLHRYAPVMTSDDMLIVSSHPHPALYIMGIPSALSFRQEAQAQNQDNAAVNEDDVIRMVVDKPEKDLVALFTSEETGLHPEEIAAYLVLREDSEHVTIWENIVDKGKYAAAMAVFINKEFANVALGLTVKNNCPSVLADVMYHFLFGNTDDQKNAYNFILHALETSEYTFDTTRDLVRIMAIDENDDSCNGFSTSRYARYLMMAMVRSANPEALAQQFPAFEGVGLESEIMKTYGALRAGEMLTNDEITILLKGIGINPPVVIPKQFAKPAEVMTQPDAVPQPHLTKNGESVLLSVCPMVRMPNFLSQHSSGGQMKIIKMLPIAEENSHSIDGFVENDYTHSIQVHKRNIRTECLPIDPPDNTLAAVIDMKSISPEMLAETLKSQVGGKQILVIPADAELPGYVSPESHDFTYLRHSTLQRVYVQSGEILSKHREATRFLDEKYIFVDTMEELLYRRKPLERYAQIAKILDNADFSVPKQEEYAIEGLQGKAARVLSNNIVPVFMLEKETRDIVGLVRASSMGKGFYYLSDESFNQNIISKEEVSEEKNEDAADANRYQFLLAYLLNNAVKKLSDVNAKNLLIIAARGEIGTRERSKMYDAAGFQVFPRQQDGYKVVMHFSSPGPVLEKMKKDISSLQVERLTSAGRFGLYHQDVSKKELVRHIQCADKEPLIRKQ